MIKQFEIHGGVKKELQAYLDARNTDLKTAMDSEERNREVAAIIHNGLPAMVRKIYSLEKMQKFFLGEKRPDGRICCRTLKRCRQETERQ